MRLLLKTVHAFLNGFPDGASGKEPACQYRRLKRHRFHPRVGKDPCRSAWQPTPVFLPGESHGQQSLAGYSPWGHKESDTTKRLTLSQLNYTRKSPLPRKECTQILKIRTWTSSEAFILSSTLATWELRTLLKHSTVPTKEAPKPKPSQDLHDATLPSDTPGNQAILQR